MKYILSHDLGTSGNKASVFNQDGVLVDSEVHSYGARYFNETWVGAGAGRLVGRGMRFHAEADSAQRH